jgi:uncharacterized protein
VEKSGNFSPGGSSQISLWPDSAADTLRPMKSSRFAAALFLCLAPLLIAREPATSPSPSVAKPIAKTWFIRLIPPRPTFAQDSTPAEDAVMEQHFAYWKDLNEKGVCIFGGPVLDPRGAFGILVVRAATEDEARALAEADPSVKAGINKIEVAEIRVAFVPVHHT